jgi:uncharacterized membrane protein
VAIATSGFFSSNVRDNGLVAGAQEPILISANFSGTLLRHQPLQPSITLAGTWLSANVVPWGVLLPYLIGTLVLVLGLYTIRKELVSRQSLDRIVALGPVFVAVSVAVFGTEHFTATKILAGMVPGWIPGHMFWALFVGTCLIGAALSIAARKYAGVAAALLGLMILLFVLLIHIPGIVNTPTSSLLWVVGFRDLSFSGGALAVAAAQREPWVPQVRQRIISLARLFIAVPITFLGVEQFLHPELAPGVPLEKSTPLWIPGHAFWGYPTGAIFVIAGLLLISNQKARLAASWLGVVILLLVLVVYVPIVVANPSDIGNGVNYLADTLLLSGCVLALAEALLTQNSS